MLQRWLRDLFGRGPRRPIRTRLGFEDLEGRVVPAFLTPVSYGTGTNPAGIAVGDFHGDGRDDMAVTSQVAAGVDGGAKVRRWGGRAAAEQT